MRAGNNQEYEEFFTFENIKLSIFFKLTTNRTIIFTGGLLFTSSSTLQIKNPPKIQVHELPPELKSTIETQIKSKKILKLRAQAMNNETSNQLEQILINPLHYLDPIPVEPNGKPSEEFSDLTPNQIIQKKLKKNYRSVLKLVLPLDAPPCKESEWSPELSNIFTKQGSFTPQKNQQKEFYSNLFLVSAGVSSLSCILGYGYWMLIHGIMTSLNVMNLSIVNIGLSLILGYFLDYLSGDESSFIRAHRCMVLALEINIILASISGEFLISTGLSSSTTVITIALITTGLSAITGIVYDIFVNRENQKNRPA